VAWRISPSPSPTAHRTRQLAPSLVEKHTTAAPLEQRHPQVILQQTHRTADRAMGQVQLLGSATEVLPARRSLETAQRQQRRQTRIHQL
jgi:hypothetical protein